jgi:hypothetical protein
MSRGFWQSGQRVAYPLCVGVSSNSSPQKSHILIGSGMAYSLGVFNALGRRAISWPVCRFGYLCHVFMRKSLTPFPLKTRASKPGELALACSAGSRAVKNSNSLRPRWSSPRAARVRGGAAALSGAAAVRDLLPVPG